MRKLLGFQNRFVGRYLIYGTGNDWGYLKENVDKRNLFLVDWERGNSHQLKLAHVVDRIEQMGTDAVVVGGDGKDLHFSAVRLDRSPEIVSQYTRKDASPGELRSQGFFYKPDGDESGIWGLPISVPRRAGYTNLFETQRRYCSCEMIRFSFVKSLSLDLSRRRRSTTSAARRVLIGTETRDHCSCVAECSRCSGTRSLRANWLTVECTRCGV